MERKKRSIKLEQKRLETRSFLVMFYLNKLIVEGKWGEVNKRIIINPENFEKEVYESLLKQIAGKLLNINYIISLQLGYKLEKPFLYRMEDMLQINVLSTPFEIYIRNLFFELGRDNKNESEEIEILLRNNKEKICVNRDKQEKREKKSKRKKRKKITIKQIKKLDSTLESK